MYILMPVEIALVYILTLTRLQATKAVVGLHGMEASFRYDVELAVRIITLPCLPAKATKTVQRPRMEASSVVRPLVRLRRI